MKNLKGLLFLLFFAALSGMFFYIAIAGLEEGQIPFGGKFQHALVPRSDYPKLYWFVELWNFGLAIFTALAVFRGFRRFAAIKREQPPVNQDNATQQAAPGDAARPAGSRRA